MFYGRIAVLMFKQHVKTLSYKLVILQIRLLDWFNRIVYMSATMAKQQQNQAEREGQASIVNPDLKPIDDTQTLY